MERFGKMVFGVVHGMVVVTVVIILAGLTPLPKAFWWTESATILPFQLLAVWLRDHFPSGYGGRLAWTGNDPVISLHSPHPCGLCRRYDPTDGGGRIASGTAIESNAGAIAEATQEPLPNT
ncbi:hypothetical protein [Methylobacter sp. G7]|uniref:hypothetical protein n=1 Tax=Methylobacter sp. G7 TaxID=3230117 RepID=UPI003D8046D6